MTFELRLIVIAFAAFSVAGIVGAIALPWLWARPWPALAPASRATLLFALRLMPAMMAVLAIGVTVTSYLFFEPRSSHETLGLVLTSLALLAASVAASAVVRLVALLRATTRVKDLWLRNDVERSFPGFALPAIVVQCRFPLVAVVGLLRPRLVIAQSVLDACPPDELQAVLRHEQGHIARRDNLRRALIAATPDLLAWLPLGRRLAHAWDDATEEAADSYVDAMGERGRVLLAQALIRVARLAPTHVSFRDLPTSALYRGENIDRRVRRLLAPPVAIAPPPAILWRAGVAVLTLIAAGIALGTVQAVIEAAVRRLP